MGYQRRVHGMIFVLISISFLWFLVVDSFKISSIFIFILILFKIYFIRNHFLSFLLSLEVIILLLVFLSGIMSTGGISTSWFLCLFFSDSLWSKCWYIYPSKSNSYSF